MTTEEKIARIIAKCNEGCISEFNWYYVADLIWDNTTWVEQEDWGASTLTRFAQDKSNPKGKKVAEMYLNMKDDDATDWEYLDLLYSYLHKMGVLKDISEWNEYVFKNFICADLNYDGNVKVIDVIYNELVRTEKMEEQVRFTEHMRIWHSGVPCIDGYYAVRAIITQNEEVTEETIADKFINGRWTNISDGITYIAWAELPKW